MATTAATKPDPGEDAAGENQESDKRPAEHKPSPATEAYLSQRSGLQGGFGGDGAVACGVQMGCGGISARVAGAQVHAQLRGDENPNKKRDR